MGCEMGKPTVVAAAHEVPEVQVTGFSENQIDAIRSTWPVLSRDYVRVGVEVFKRIFREMPSVFELFGLGAYSIQRVEDLHTLPPFREHATKFMGVLASLVDNLEDPHEVDEALLLLGAKHATFNGYHSEYFLSFGKCMLDAWEMELGEEFIAEVRESWRLLFDYIMTRMKQGFEMCLSGELHDFIYDDHPAVSGGTPAGDTAPRDNRNQSFHLADAEDGMVRVQ